MLQGKAAFFIHFERLKGIRSSSILTFYWVLYVVLWIFVFRTQVKLLLKDEVRHFVISYNIILCYNDNVSVIA